MTKHELKKDMSNCFFLWQSLTWLSNIYIIILVKNNIYIVATITTKQLQLRNSLCTGPLETCQTLCAEYIQQCNQMNVPMDTCSLHYESHACTYQHEHIILNRDKHLISFIEHASLISCDFCLVEEISCSCQSCLTKWRRYSSFLLCFISSSFIYIWNMYMDHI